MTLLLAVSLAFRLYMLEAAPPGLQHDEAFNAHDAVQVLIGTRPIFFTGNYGREPFFVYLMAGFIALLGRNPLAVRLPAVFCGVAGQILLYLLMRKLFGSRTAVLTLAITTISFWHVFDSRVGLRAISLPMLLTLSLYLLWTGLSNKRVVYWILSGASLGLAFYTYIPGRIAILVPLLFLAYVAIVRRDSIRKQWPAVLLWLVTALAVMAPLGLYMLRNPEAVSGRVSVLNYTVDQLVSGNLMPVLKSAGSMLAMFTFKGDIDWRYNLSGLPVFDIVTGVFFYFGLLVCLYRWKNPRGVLLVIWMVVMLAPSVLSGDGASSLKAAGAMPAILALPAVGIVTSWDYLRRKVQAADMFVCALLVVGFIAGAAVTYKNYFVVWANAEEPRPIYEADIAETARYLNTLPDRPLVCISTDFAFDLDRYVMDTELHKEYQIKWFDGRQAFVLPATPSGLDVLYVFTASAPLPDFIAKQYFLGLDPIYQPTDPRGVPIITVYRVSLEVAEEQRQIAPSEPLNAQLGQVATLMGYDMPDSVRQADAVRAVIYWRPLGKYTGDYSQAPVFFAHLRDSQENFWAQDDGIGYPAWDWDSGDIALNWFAIPTTGDFPLQDYWVHIGMSAAGEQLPILADTGEALGQQIRLAQPVRMERALAPVPIESIPIQTHASLEFGGEIALRGYTMAKEVRPGDKVTLVLFWQSVSQPEGDYSVRIRLSDSSGQARLEQTDALWADVYPTSQWYAGGFVRSYHVLALPRDIGPDTLSLEIGLIDARGQEIQESLGTGQIGELVVGGRQRLMEIPKDIQHSLRAELGDSILLIGYALESQTVAPGDTVHLTLYWQATGSPARSYTVFTHVLGPDGSMAGQKDSPPDDGDRPTNGWIEGEFIVDPYEIPLKLDLPDGEYLLEVGMYDPSTPTFDRLPVTIGGKQEPDRRIVLGQITVQWK